MSTRSFKLAKILGATGTIKAAALDSNAVGGGVKLAENDSADLGTGEAGDLKFASNRKTLHLYDGTEWERIAGGQDAEPIILTDPAAATIQAGTTDSHRQTYKVVDPEGFPISYSISYMRDSDKVFFTNDSSNLPPPLAHPAIITKAADGSATYKFLTRQTESDGSGYTTLDLYKARYMGSDGARQVVSTKDFKIQFSLYEMTFPFTFTRGTYAGRYGPTLAHITAWYTSNYTGDWWTNTDNLNMNYQGIQEWTVPEAGTYTIQAAGACGARYNDDQLTGTGAQIKADFALNSGDVISIAVGQNGVRDGSGGGGSFVVKKNSATSYTPLIIAGGGGGERTGQGTMVGWGIADPTSEDGNPGGRYNQGVAYAGGTGGNGGSAGTSNGGAGGGYYTNGQYPPSAGYSGRGFLQGGNAPVGSPTGNQFNGSLVGGMVGTWTNSNDEQGGFGGGAGTSDDQGAGGGGYSGGGGTTEDQHGGAGGSYVDAGATNRVNMSNNTSHGFVTVTKL